MMIRRGVAADASVLAALARDTFVDTFAATNDAADMALHLERAYGVAQQAAELASPNMVTLLVEAEGTAIAYAQLRAGHVPECVMGLGPLVCSPDQECPPAQKCPPDENYIELWRFYVHREWHGRGVASSLMERVKTESKVRGAKTIWLGVWERNPRAQAFYRKCGFRDVGEHIFLFGTDPQTDRVMAMPL